MKRMGIEEQIRERVVDEKGLVLVNRKGERAVVFAKEDQTQQINQGKKTQKRQGFSAEWYARSTIRLMCAANHCIGIGRLCVVTFAKSSTMLPRT